MKYIIIEDEEPAVRGLHNLVQRAKPEALFQASFPSIKKAVDWLKSKPSPDLIFLDIHLKDGSGFELFQQLDVQSPVIFCTAYDEYLMEAFKTNGIDYLLKPLDYGRLQQSLEKFDALQLHFGKKEEPRVQHLLQQIRERALGPQRFLVKMGKKFYAIETSEIAYFFTKHTIVYLMTIQGKKYQVDQSLDRLEESLSKAQFFRINRQYLVAWKSIRSFESDYGSFPVHLDPPPQQPITISRHRIDNFKHWWGG